MQSYNGNAQRNLNNDTAGHAMGRQAVTHSGNAMQRFASVSIALGATILAGTAIRRGEEDIVYIAGFSTFSNEIGLAAKLGV